MTVRTWLILGLSIACLIPGGLVAYAVYVCATVAVLAGFMLMGVAIATIAWAVALFAHHACLILEISLMSLPALFLLAVENWAGIINALKRLFGL